MKTTPKKVTKKATKKATAKKATAKKATAKAKKKSIDKKALKKAAGYDDPSLADVHRVIPKTEGGKYTEDNSVVMTPEAHMREHGIWRDRTEVLDELKALVDDREQIVKLDAKIKNQLDAAKRGVDRISLETREYLVGIRKDIIRRKRMVDKLIANKLKELNDPIVAVALAVPGLGHTTLATILSYFDIHKAKSVSAMWSYAGYHKAGHERNKRLVGGEKRSDGHGNVRTSMYKLAMVFIRGVTKKEGGRPDRCPNEYVKIYNRETLRLEASQKMVKAYVGKGKGLQLVKWCDTTPKHRQLAAIRKMMKHFLADLWFVWRSVEGLSIRSLYVEEKLGHTGIIRPEERGWIYNAPDWDELSNEIGDYE